LLIFERSPHSSFHAFCKLSRELGYLAFGEFELLRERYRGVCEVIRSLGIREEVRFMDETTARANSRGVGDAAITVEYQKKLKFYTSWLGNLESHTTELGG